MAKAVAWPVTDAEARKRGEQIGLDTLVVDTVNDAYFLFFPLFGGFKKLC